MGKPSGSTRFNSVNRENRLTELQGIYAFVWNLVMFLGCFACDSWLLLVLVIGDLLVALPLLASAVKQAMFAPTTYSACGDAINWRNGTDGRNFFLAAEWVAWETYGPAESFCKNMTENWAITIAMV